jgi:hypothetical protein
MWDRQTADHGSTFGQVSNEGAFHNHVAGIAW